MKRNFLKINVGDMPTTCIVDGQPVRSAQYPDNFEWPVTVSNIQYTLSAGKKVHAALQKMGAQVGTMFKISKVQGENGFTPFQITDNTGNEVTGGSSGGYQQSTGGGKKSYQRSPEETASIVAQWATGKAIDALVLYKGQGNQLPDELGATIVAMAKKYYGYSREVKSFILEDLLNTGKEDSHS